MCAFDHGVGLRVARGDEFVANGVVLGDNVKVQNNVFATAQIYFFSFF